MQLVSFFRLLKTKGRRSGNQSGRSLSSTLRSTRFSRTSLKISLSFKRTVLTSESPTMTLLCRLLPEFYVLMFSSDMMLRIIYMSTHCRRIAPTLGHTVLSWRGGCILTAAFWWSACKWTATLSGCCHLSKVHGKMDLPCLNFGIGAPVLIGM